MLLSGIHGPQIWQQPVATYVGFDHVLGALPAKDVVGYTLLAAFFLGHLPGCIVHVMAVRRRQGLSMAEPLLQWTPMLIFSASLCAWIGSPRTTILSDNHFVLLCVTLSFVFGRMTTKIILAHLTRQSFPYWTALLLPLVGGAVLVNLPFFGFEAASRATEITYLRAYFVVAVVVYFRWAHLVITAICNHLGINCFTIPQDTYDARKKTR